MGDGPAVAVVRAIAALADALGLGVLAEGVETEDQLTQLAALGVQQGQGFLWGRAVTAEQATWALTPTGVDRRELAVPPARRSLDLTIDLGTPR
jgi:EAL domain-containing protein (putative c-di-GMP-specific phosphodiesterase class I)